MFKYYNPLLSKNGDVLPGRYVRLFTAGGAEVDLFADASGTPISTVSGVANAAVSDTLGMVRFYVANGTYDLRIYDEGDNFVSAEVGVPMLDAGGVYDDLASTDAEKGAALVKFSSGDTVEDLASDAAGKGASLVKMESGETAEVAILARPTTAALASSTGGEMVGFEQDGAGAVLRTQTDKARDIVSVKDFGATGDGATNDRTAIQAAFDSGAKKVIFPGGEYVVTGGGLTVPDWLTVVGEGYGPTSVPGDAGVLIKFSLTSGVALDCGFNPTFDNIYFVNIGGSYDEGTATLSGTTAACVALTDNLTMNYCSFAGWQNCIMFGASTFYVKTFGVEFNRCTNGYKTDGTAPYNIDIYAPISRLTTNFFAGQSAHPARNIKVHGGSIEGYSSVAFGFLDASFFGTYFETISQRAGAIAIDPEVNGSSVTLVGCLIYMNYTARFANMSGRTGVMLTSVGNQYDGVAPSGAVCLYMPTSGSVNLSGDRFGNGHPNNATYVDSLPAAAQFNGITFPVLPSGNTHAAYSGMALVGARGFISFGLSAEPSAKTTGMTVMADGDSWDPLSRAAGRPYWTIWQGDRWYGLSGA